MKNDVFTVGEANALIPEIEKALKLIQETKERISTLSGQVEVLELLWGDKIEEQDNPDFATYQKQRRSISSAVSQIEQIVQDQIIRRGVRFPVGGIQEGLVDFPTTYNGRIVYLCWRVGEPEIQYWHETDAGYRGRQSVTDDHRRIMGHE